LLVYQAALPRLVFLREFEEGDFDHAVDNFGDSVGLVADWVTLARWWRPYPPAARGCCGNLDYQPGNRSTSGLAQRIFPAIRAKTQRKLA
jgi:hypothetical protein